MYVCMCVCVCALLLICVFVCVIVDMCVCVCIIVDMLMGNEQKKMVRFDTNTPESASTPSVIEPHNDDIDIKSAQTPPTPPVRRNLTQELDELNDEREALLSNESQSSSSMEVDRERHNVATATAAASLPPLPPVPPGRLQHSGSHVSLGSVILRRAAEDEKQQQQQPKPIAPPQAQVPSDSAVGVEGIDKSLLDNEEAVHPNGEHKHSLSNEMKQKQKSVIEVDPVPSASVSINASIPQQQQQQQSPSESHSNQAASLDIQPADLQS